MQANEVRHSLKMREPSVRLRPQTPELFESSLQSCLTVSCIHGSAVPAIQRLLAVIFYICYEGTNRTHTHDRQGKDRQG
jgi:hypothetical protein